MTILPDYQYTRVLAIDPCKTGFGFAVLEGRRRLLDWGVALVWAPSDKEFIARVEAMAIRYRPALLVLQEPQDRKRSPRAIRRIRAAAAYAAVAGMRAIQISRVRLRATFQGAGSTKHEIALAIAGLYPELEPHLPRRRKPWMSEDERMNIFDAVAMAVTALNSEVNVSRLT